jgi:hypothetical protein
MIPAAAGIKVRQFLSNYKKSLTEVLLKNIILKRISKRKREKK